jgi:DNA-binding response OmpR family regulator
MRILVADDDRVSLRVLESTLRQWGHEVETASDGLSAWEALARTDQPTLALLDWMMPGMDGVDVCRGLKERAGGPLVYTILLTGRNSAEDRGQAIEAGADDYMVKPLDSGELRFRLRAGIRILELQSALLEAMRSLPPAEQGGRPLAG